MTLNIDNLDDLQLDVLKEIGNIGSGNAATSLAKILNRKVDMSIPKVKIVRFEDVSNILGGEEIQVIGILLNVTGNLKGHIMFILERSAAKTLVNILMGSVSNDDNEAIEFNDIELSALKEVGNILVGSYVSALSSLTDLKILVSTPDISIDMAGAILSVIAIEFGKVGDSVLYIENEFFGGDRKVLGGFFLVPYVESYDILLRALGVIS